MSGETRTFRPFNIDERLAGALEQAEFSYGDLQCGVGERMLIEDRSFGMRSPTLSWSPEHQFKRFKQDLVTGIAATGLDASHLSLVVTARSGHLKLSEVAYCHPLADMAGINREIRLGNQLDGSRRAVFSTETHGATVDAYIALRRTIPTVPLRPFRIATWLVRASFRIECESDSSLFRPRPLDEENRRRLRLRGGVTRFIEFEGGDLTDPISGGEIPTLWVDELLITDLDRMRNSPLARHLQLQLALDFISGVVFEFSRKAAGGDRRGEYAVLTYEDIKDSLLGRVVRFIAGSRAGSDQRQQVLKVCRDDPRLVIAWAEDSVGARAATFKALEQ